MIAAIVLLFIYRNNSKFPLHFRPTTWISPRSAIIPRIPAFVTSVSKDMKEELEWGNAKDRQNMIDKYSSGEDLYTCSYLRAFPGIYDDMFGGTYSQEAYHQIETVLTQLGWKIDINIINVTSWLWMDDDNNIDVDKGYRADLVRRWSSVSVCVRLSLSLALEVPRVQVGNRTDKNYPA